MLVSCHGLKAGLDSRKENVPFFRIFEVIFASNNNKNQAQTGLNLTENSEAAWSSGMV